MILVREKRALKAKYMVGPTSYYSQSQTCRKPNPNPPFHPSFSLSRLFPPPLPASLSRLKLPHCVTSRDSPFYLPLSHSLSLSTSFKSFLIREYRQKSRNPSSSLPPLSVRSGRPLSIFALTPRFDVGSLFSSSSTGLDVLITNFGRYTR